MGAETIEAQPRAVLPPAADGVDALRVSAQNRRQSLALAMGAAGLAAALLIALFGR